MKLMCTTAIVLIAASSPAFAQKATAVGVGVANSSSQSGALAISGQGGGGGSANSALTINSAAQPAVTTTNIHQSGSVTERNVPAVFAPGLAAAGLETCLGSVSGGGAFVGTGFSFGTSIPDPGCAARLDARTLWSMGLKKAAVARLCLNGDIYRSMPDVCAAYLPQAPAVVAPVGYAPVPLEPVAYRGGPVMLTVRSTGQDRLCNDYNPSTQRCRVWAQGIVTPKRKVASVTKPAVPTPPIKPQAPAEVSEGNVK